MRAKDTRLLIIVLDYRIKGVLEIQRSFYILLGG